LDDSSSLSLLSLSFRGTLAAQACYLSYCLACLSPDLLLGLLAVAECRFALGLNAIDSNVC
ncbi:hypothetical protein, partial [Shewanella algae]|uniref:hypothetical protein n=1 Tax=Shewanella algae TaxID=38313 RepID=UPI0030071237